MQASNGYEGTQIHDHWEANSRPNQLSYPSKLMDD